MVEIKHSAPGSGAGTDDQTALEVPTDTANFNGHLSGADSDVQKALDTLDDIAAGGDVVGPASATDTAVALWDTTSGKLLQNSAILESELETLTDTSNADALHTHHAGYIAFTPTGFISATTVQTAIAEVDSEKALVAHTHPHSATTGQTINDHHNELHNLGSHTQLSNRIFMTNGAVFTQIALGASGTYLKSQGDGMDLTWDTPSGGSGDVSGPGSSTDNAVALWDGTGGDTLSDSAILESELETLTDGSNADALHVHDYNKYVHPNHSGDVVSVADGATTIQDGVVTPAKLLDMPTDRIRGRNTAGSGDVENLLPSTVLGMIGAAPVDAPYLCLGTGDPTLTNERYLVLGAGLDYTDQSADSYYAIHVQDYTVLSIVTSAVAVNAVGGAKFELEIDEDVTISNPTNESIYWKDGQAVEIRITQDSTGGWEVTWDSDYRTGEIPSVQIAAGSSETTYVLMKYNALVGKMDIVAFMRGY